MRPELEFKYNTLKSYFNELEEVVIAYSGDLESTLLLKVAKDELRDEVIAIIGRTESMSNDDFVDALFAARELGVEPMVVDSDEMNSPDYCNNPITKCTDCKLHVFNSFHQFMRDNRLLHLVDGSKGVNSAEKNTHHNRITDISILSPLKELDFTTEDIRELSRKLELTIWTKETNYCLTSDSENVTQPAIERMEKLQEAEQFLTRLDFYNVRTRLQGETIKIEVSPEQKHRFFDSQIRHSIIVKMKALGYSNVSIDMEVKKRESVI